MKKRHANKILQGNILHQNHIEFMKWAENYDNGGLDMRSRKRHEKWLSKLTCIVLRIEEDIEMEAKVNLVKSAICNL